MSVGKNMKKLEKTALFVMKVILFLGLFIIFFGLFSIDNPQILRTSRTAAITMTTFVILGISMTAVYGGFAVGKKKSKDIVAPLSIAAFITDIVTYLQLSIMNVNQYNKPHLIFESLGILLLTIILQVCLIYVMVHLGNFLYFKINPPEQCIVICSDIEKSKDILYKIGRYKKQFHITDVITCENANIKKYIRHCDSIFLYEVPSEHKSFIIDYAYKYLKNIYLTTETSDVVINYAKPMVLDDISVLASNVKGLSIEQRFLKRLIDIIISLTAIIITSPIMIIEAILIKSYDKGPVFFKQERATLNGKVFNVLKFRTMIVDADKKDGGYHPATKKDSRITPVGKVLRRLRLDELPQFFNILKGDMSVVGPRPERVEHVEMYTADLPQFSYRLRVKAGLTGLAQISGKYNTSPKDKLMLDLMYIEKYSIWTDIMLMFQTLSVFFKSESTQGFEENEMIEFVKHQKEENIKHTK